MRYLADTLDIRKTDRVTMEQVSQACQQARRYAQTIWYIDRNMVNIQASQSVMAAWERFSRQFYSIDRFVIYITVTNAYSVELRRLRALWAS